MFFFFPLLSICPRLKSATPQLEEDCSYHHCHFTWSLSLELDFVQKRGFKKKKKKDHNSDYPATASIIMLFRKIKTNNKKRKNQKWLLLLQYFLISTFPLDIMWILQCWLLASSTSWQETDRGRCCWRNGHVARRRSEVKWRKWMEKKRVLEGNLWEKRWKTDVFTFFIFIYHRRLSPKCYGLWRILAWCWAFGISNWDRFGLVCLKVAEGLLWEWQDGRKKVKGKGRKPSLRWAVA